MSRLYLDIKIEECNNAGAWVSCWAGATGIGSFNNIYFWHFFPGDPTPATITATLGPMAVSAIAVETGVTLSLLTAVISGLPVGL